MKKSCVTFCLVCSMALMMSGCGKNKTMEKDAIVPLESPIIETVEPSVETTVTVEPTKDHKGEVKSVLTGDWISKKIAKRRPYAFMINNIEYASPQDGTSQASILYEAVVEGGITRLMGIYEDFDAKRIGSARSARHYFVSFADEYDAIFCHFGQTKYALSKISELGVDNLSGLEAVGSTVYYRDKSIKAPHNAFASYQGIMNGTKQKKYRTERRDNVNAFSFYDKNTKIDGKKVKKVTLGFSNYTSPYFEYDKKKGKFLRYQFGEKHIDKTTGKQLAFKNIIIQFVKEWDIDKNGYQTMDIENATGEGYYLTNGKYQKITWSKKESTKERTYFDSEGNPLKLNVGKTYIAIYPLKRVDHLTFS